MVVAAHPDDEMLGCGGTMAKHTRRGDRVHILILSEGQTSRSFSRATKRNQASLRKLADAARNAAHIVGATSIKLLGLPDNRLDSLELLDIVKPIEAFIQAHHPNIVYTHHAGDLNIDHQIAHAAVLTACRPQPGHPVRSLRFFEVPSSTEWQTPDSGHAFAPNWFMNISETLATKQQALAAYAAEIRPWPHPRSYRAIEALARWRGATVGVEAAEAFISGREVEP